MGGLVGSIFDLASGDPTKEQEGQLGDLSNFTSNTGQGAINAAQTYDLGILSGDPAQVAKTLAPEISSGAQSVQQQAMTNAQFGNRGGGTNASTQGAQSNERGNIINLEGGLQQGAAAAEAGIGTNLLSQATGNITADAGLKSTNQQRESSDVGGIAQGAAEIASGFADPAATTDPYQMLYSAQHAGPVATEDATLSGSVQPDAAPSYQFP